MSHPLQWQKFPVLNDGFICLVDHMGDDSSIVQAARVSYGKDLRTDGHQLFETGDKDAPNSIKDSNGEVVLGLCKKCGAAEVQLDQYPCTNEREKDPLLKAAETVLGFELDYFNVENSAFQIYATYKRKGDSNESIISGSNTMYQIMFQEKHDRLYGVKESLPDKDRTLIRYLLAHGHTSPFEMVELKFLVRVPMDCWRQWIRHRTASVNEYSTRYTEAIDSQQTTPPQEWRLQATDNKQGSSGFLEEWPNTVVTEEVQLCANGGFPSLQRIPGDFLSEDEQRLIEISKQVYKTRLALGVAKEQARKDLPLSTYTEAYWKCDLHNIFNFLRLRMDSHAQLEIRMYANAMYEIVKQVCPVACEAFEDYVLHVKKFSRMEMNYLGNLLNSLDIKLLPEDKPYGLTDREWKEFLGKLS